MPSVHGDEGIGAKIGFPELRRAMGGSVVPTAAQLRDRALVGALAHMPAAEPARARLRNGIEPALLESITDNDFGHGRTADISSADEDQLHDL